MILQIFNGFSDFLDDLNDFCVFLIMSFFKVKIPEKKFGFPFVEPVSAAASAAAMI